MINEHNKSNKLNDLRIRLLMSKYGNILYAKHEVD